MPVSFVCVRVCVRVPVGRLAGTRTAAAAGAVGPSGAARYSRGAADGAGPHAQHPGCNEPAEPLGCYRNIDGNRRALLLLEGEQRLWSAAHRFGVIGSGCQRLRVARTERPLEDVQQSFAILAHLKKKRHTRLISPLSGATLRSHSAKGYKPPQCSAEKA